MPRSRPGRSGGAAVHLDAAFVGREQPARSISVVLPLPEKPTIATNSPGASAKSTAARARSGVGRTCAGSSCRRRAARARAADRASGGRGSSWLTARCERQSSCGRAAKPMTPIVKTATRIRASVSALPFWNMSQTNFPRPGFWASISAAISTIQPTPSESRSPVKISGNADGSTILRTRVAPGEPQHARDVQVVAVDGGDAERGVDQRRPQRAERDRDRRGQERLLEPAGRARCTSALTRIITIGSQASGDTGLKSWISGFSAA